MREFIGSLQPAFAHRRVAEGTAGILAFAELDGSLALGVDSVN
jgi:hypothetical protein